MLRIAFFRKYFVSVIFFAFLRVNGLGIFFCSKYIESLEQKMTEKTADKYYCEICDFKCCKLSNWNSHLLTRKHESRTNRTKKAAETAEPTEQKFACERCNKEYKARNSLWYHQQKCKPGNESMIQRLLNENQELRNFIIEQSKINTDLINKALESNKTTVINQTNTQNNNQKFNINMFLNEECKDAINFSDFIKSIEVSREDLENNAQLGFVNGVSKILIESLKQLDRTERPIHCTDIKRETMYIKDEDKWNKEEDSSKLNKAIQEVTRKSMGTLMNWKEENPDYKDRDSEFSNRCIVIQQQSMAAHNRDTYYPKVVKAIAKEVTI